MAWSVRPVSALLVLAACPAGPDNNSSPASEASTTSATDVGPTEPPPTDTTVTPDTTVPTVDPDTTLTTIDPDTTLTTIDPDTTLDPTTTTTTPPDPVCGDGFVSDGEVCDDGNTVDGDCCSADCSVGPSEPGQVCWTVTFEGLKNGADRGVGVALDAGTDVYVAATVIDDVPGSDILVRRYDPGAVSQWTQQFDGGVNGTDIALAMAGDDAGFMIAVGRQTTMQGMPSVMWLTKCTPTGQTLWSTFDPGPVSGGGIALADASGEFVVVGSINQGGNNALVRRYDPNGSELWTEVFSGPDGGTDIASGVAVDGAGNIIVAGREFTDAAAFNIWVQQYGPGGDAGWTASFDGPASGADWANDVAVDPDDDSVIVVGRVDVGGGFSDAWIRKYDAGGDELWTQTFAGQGGMSDDAVAVAVAPGGDFAVTGQTFVADHSDIFVSKRDKDGDELWLRSFDGEQSSDDQPGDVAVAGDGSVVVIGTTAIVPMINSDVWLRKYSP
ncbi:MAG: hypothetical protein JNL82_29195 [Myxococcales bacterium]|nr:hypothetical protein [Myxococcales bacterium]